MVTPRTHSHFTMQARALRSCLVTNSLAEPRYRSVNTFVLPDPLLTQGGPVTFLPCALLFVRSCDLAHHGPYCSHVCACTHHSSLQHLPFCVCLRCHSVPLWMNFRTCGCLLAPQGGITLTTRVFRLNITLSPTVTSWCDFPVPCAEIGFHKGVTWCSDFKLCVLPTGYTQ